MNRSCGSCQRKAPRHDAEGKLAARWGYRHYLGFSRYSNDYLFWTKEGAVKSRTHMRMASDRRWPAGGVESIDQGANSGYAPRVPERFAPGEDASLPEVAPARATQTFQIKYADWLEHGSTPGCAKCSHAQLYGWGKMGGPHAADCVERFREIIMERKQVSNGSREQS